MVATLKYRNRANKYKHLYLETQKPRKVNGHHTSPAAIKAREELDKYLEIRSQILLRDQFRCQECGYFKHLEVHHIVPRSKGGSDDPNNLVTLCQRCHRKKHGFAPQVNKRRRHSKRNKRRKFKRYMNRHTREIVRKEFPFDHPVQSTEDVHLKIRNSDMTPEAVAKRRKNYEKWERNELNQLTRKEDHHE